MPGEPLLDYGHCILRLDAAGLSAAFRRQIGALVAVCQDPQQPQDIPRVLEIAKKFGLEFLPPPGA